MGSFRTHELDLGQRSLIQTRLEHRSEIRAGDSKDPSRAAYQRCRSAGSVIDRAVVFIPDSEVQREVFGNLEVVLHEPGILVGRPSPLLIEAGNIFRVNRVIYVKGLIHAVDASGQVVQHALSEGAVGADSRNAGDVQGSAECAISLVDARRHIEGIETVARKKKDFTSGLEGVLTSEPGNRVTVLVSRSGACIGSDHRGGVITGRKRTGNLAEAQ